MKDKRVECENPYASLDGLYGYDVYVRGHKPKLSEEEEHTIFDVLLLVGEYDKLKRRVMDCNR